MTYRIHTSQMIRKAGDFHCRAAQVMLPNRTDVTYWKADKEFRTDGRLISRAEADAILARNTGLTADCVTVF